MSNGLDVIFSVKDSEDIKDFLNAVENENCRKFLWALNPNNEFIKLAKTQDISLFCNNVFISKQEELINGSMTSEYKMYKRNIRFKALNRMIFFQYKNIVFLNNSDFKIDWNLINRINFDLIIKNDDFFVVKNNTRTKKFFFDFEEYIVFLKDLKEGRNVFSYHNFLYELKFFNINRHLFFEDKKNNLISIYEI